MMFSNYRPVSVLPVLWKILEKLVYNQFVLYISDHDLLHEWLHLDSKRESQLIWLW